MRACGICGTPRSSPRCLRPTSHFEAHSVTSWWGRRAQSPRASRIRSRAADLDSPGDHRASLDWVGTLDLKVGLDGDCGCLPVSGGKYPCCLNGEPHRCEQRCVFQGGSGWEAGIRTPISRVRVCCPTVERPPNGLGTSEYTGAPAPLQPRTHPRGPHERPTPGPSPARPRAAAPALGRACPPPAGSPAGCPLSQPGNQRRQRQRTQHRRHQHGTGHQRRRHIKLHRQNRRRHRHRHR